MAACATTCSRSYALRSCRTGQHEETQPSNHSRTSLFRPTNPVTKFLRPHLSAGSRTARTRGFGCSHARQVLTRTAEQPTVRSDTKGPGSTIESNWLLHTSTAVPFHSEEYKLPGLGTPELHRLRQTLAGKIARGASKPKPPPATADLTSTTNGAATFASSGSARTDLFFKVKEPGMYLPVSIEDTTTPLLQQAWEEDPLDTLKLIAHLRDVRDGKADQDLFHDCIAWLWQDHPLTLLANLDEIVKVGYWKDLLEILVRACVDAEQLQERKDLQAQTRNFMKWGTGKPDTLNIAKLKEKHPMLVQMCKTEWRKHYRSLKTDEDKRQARAERAKQTAEKTRIISEHQLQQKQDKHKQASSNMAMKYADDKVRLLHLSVAVAFAEQLQKDDGAWKEGRPGDVSLAPKWAPTPKGSHDKDTLIASSIAQLLFPRANAQSGANKTSSNSAPGTAYSGPVLTARSRYRKLLVPLRKCLDIPEVYMCANKWQDVKYTRVPSVCMKNNKGKFEKHDEERFTQYLVDVKAGKKTIASGALKPHELVREAMQHSGQAYISAEDQQKSSALSLETMELQWKDYVTQLKKSGTLSNALAIADVSGSMMGEPMQVSIALSLLVAQVAGPPFHNTILTFSETPKLHTVQGATLVDQVSDVEDMEWGGSTNLNAAFSLILQRAREAKVPQDQMIETLFIFSDMQFDYACCSYSSKWGDRHVTNYTAAQEEFERYGYKLPKVVFWNLRGYGMGESASMPVTQTEEGTALVSGFSGQLLKLFMDGVQELESFNPFNIMKEAIGKEKYNGWKVID